MSSVLCRLTAALLAAAPAAAAVAGDGPSARPPYAEPVGDFPENTMHLYWGGSFGGGAPHRITDVTSNPPGVLLDFEDQKFLRNIKDDMSSLKWSLPPGVVVVLYEDSRGREEQLVIWGSGQIRSVFPLDFADKLSRWAWFDVNDSVPPIGAEPPGASSGGALELGGDVTLEPEAELQPVTTVATSLSWDLPAGVIVLLFERDATGGKQKGVWARGQLTSIRRGNLDGAPARWAWFDLAGAATTTSATRGPRDASHCTQCGHGAPSSANWKFCPRCGSRWAG